MSSETQVGHFYKDDCDFYIGRDKGNRHFLSVSRYGARGCLGNPFTVEQCGREEAIERFRKAFEYEIKHSPNLAEFVESLAGKTLGCWCRRVGEESPACHGDVIAEWADRLANGDEVGDSG